MMAISVASIALSVWALVGLRRLERRLDETEARLRQQWLRLLAGGAQ